MKISGDVAQAVMIAAADHLRDMNRIRNPLFKMVLESFDLEVVDDRKEWKIGVYPSTAVRQEMNRKNPGVLISLNEYCCDYVIRKSDFKILARYGSQ